MTFGIAQDSWNRLQENLIECHQLANPSLAATNVINGWIAALGPAFESRRQSELVQRVVQTAHRFGFRETNPANTRRAWLAAGCSWDQRLTRTLKKYQTIHG